MVIGQPAVVVSADRGVDPDIAQPFRRLCRGIKQRGPDAKTCATDLHKARDIAGLGRQVRVWADPLKTDDVLLVIQRHMPCALVGIGGHPFGQILTGDRARHRGGAANGDNLV